MSLPSGFGQDRQVLLQKYRTWPTGVEPPQSTDFHVHVFEWENDSPEGTDWSAQSVFEFEQKMSPNSLVRLVLTNRDVPRPSYVYELTRMFSQCNIPSTFILESLQGVSRSFGSQTDAEGARTLWFHILGKHVETATENGQVRIVHAGQYMSQDNPIWTKTGVVLRAQGHQNSPSPTNLAIPRIVMYCFGEPATFRERVQRITKELSCEEMLRDPYMLVGVLMEEMYKLLDEASWAVGHSFRPIESKTLKGTERDIFKASEEISFSGLHNLAKHTIFLRENCESALFTLENFRAFHDTTLGRNANSFQKALQENLAYQKTLLQSTGQRLSSLDRRMNNIIQFSFHLVTQSDSRTMQSENKSMKTIAVMTLFFMPLSTVAAVFGTEFFYISEEGPFSVSVSQDFWLLWLVAGPLTFMVIVIWRFWYWDARAELIGKMPGTGGRHLYGGLKSLERCFSRKKIQKSKPVDALIEMS